MAQKLHAYDSVHWYMNELTSRIIAKSGIATDRFHIGKLILQGLKDDPYFILHVDGATNQSETFASALKRSVQCAICFRNMGLGQGDVIVLMAPNHLDLSIPYYAAMYLGAAVNALDVNLGVAELKHMFIVNKPKLIFCQNEKAKVIDMALKEANLEAGIITFDNGTDHINFSDLMDMSVDNDTVDNFMPTDFDPENTVALLTVTSGTTGLPKSAALTHKNFSLSVPYFWLGFSTFPTPTKRVLILSPLQWLTAGIHFTFSPIFRFTRIQSSAEMSTDHIYHLINEYKPTYSSLSPTLMTTLIKSDERNLCDFTTFKTILLGGSHTTKDLIEETKQITGTMDVRPVYGMSEIGGLAFYDQYPLPGSLGKPIGCHEYRLVDMETNADITEPNISGELWLKGPCIIKEYYKNPKITSETFSEDGWFRTGDIIRRDENWNFYFVERLKLLLKYKNHQISPVEVENVIRQHPGVVDVAVTSLPDLECGDLPVACVVTRTGFDVTAQQIKDLVKESLADSKQLRGGVIFMSELPTTVSTKVHRQKLKEMVLSMERE